MCPAQPEIFNGFQDRDGCPDTYGSGDLDLDGVIDSDDECPLAKETYNKFQDTDGCPDSISGFSALDFDGDGITDLNDKCPLEPETINGYQDTDGCPDVSVWILMVMEFKMF